MILLKKNNDGITQVQKVEDFEYSTIASLGLTIDTLLFKENGETRIYNAEISGLIDCSEETVTLINKTTDLNLIPTVGAVTGYINEVKDSFGSSDIEIPENIATIEYVDEKLKNMGANGNHIACICKTPPPGMIDGMIWIKGDELTPKYVSSITGTSVVSGEVDPSTCKDFTIIIK
jgi:hypothetical protein